MRINEITQEQKVNIKCLISKCDKGKTVKDTPYLSLILEDATGCEILEFNECAD